MTAGESFDLSQDAEILKINSPRANVNGPYKVVYKNEERRWALGAFDWDEEPHLGIRWFWGTAGMPALQGGNAGWFVVPTELTTAILNGLPINAKIRGKIDDFLGGKIDGKTLSGGE
ncbi:MAG: hypothetical protein LBQ14_02985 [Treponema sp.]|jgi:hypothetical protein|nr:hypothetical protein [Treponema sp.]